MRAKPNLAHICTDSKNVLALARVGFGRRGGSIPPTAKNYTTNNNAYTHALGGSLIVGQKALKPVASTVDIYVRIASNCPGIEHVGKKKHSTKARDTAVRSFRAVSTYIAVVLASQSYAVVESEWVHKKIKGTRDVNTLIH